MYTPSGAGPPGGPVPAAGHKGRGHAMTPPRAMTLPNGLPAWLRRRPESAVAALLLLVLVATVHEID